MSGLKPIGLLKNEKGQWKCIVAGNDSTETNGINKYSEGGSEILYWLELTGVKPMGSLTNEFGFRASENCQNWQN